MDVVNAAFNIVFEPDPQVRRYEFDFENAFGDDFIKPYNVFPVPDDAPLEIPRIVTVTKKGHSQLAVSAQSAQISTEFDRNFSRNSVQCLDYSKQKALDLQRALSTVGKLPIQFGGLSVTLALKVQNGKSPVEYMEERYLRTSSAHPLADATLRLVYEIDDEYYFNLETREGRLDVDPLVDHHDVDAPTPGLRSGVVTNEGAENDAFVTDDVSERLVINIDFNNRLAFNNGNVSGCTPETVGHLYSRVLHFIENGLDTFVDHAEVDF